MSFTTTKDRVWVAYDVFAGWLARRSMPVRKAGYGIFGAVLWAAYLWPGGTVRPTIASLAHHAGHPSQRRLFRDYVRGFLRGMNRTEQVRHGRTEAVDAMFRLPDKSRLDAIMEQGGCVLVIPHTHASLAMGRGLARHYDLLALLRSTGNERRAASERQIYANLDCDWLDIRVENPTKVARRVLNALNSGRLVIATVDRINNAPPPDKPVNSSSDTVRATAYGQPIGIAGWPARFSHKAGVPIIPVMAVQTEDTISLILGEAITPTSDIVETTQTWVSEMERLMKTYPDEWTFALDKFWSRALRNAHPG